MSSSLAYYLLSVPRLFLRHLLLLYHLSLSRLHPLLFPSPPSSIVLFHFFSFLLFFSFSFISPSYLIANDHPKLSKVEVELAMREQTHQEEMQIILSRLRQAQDQVASLQVHVQQYHLQLQVQSILERLNSVLPQRMEEELSAISGVILTETGQELHLPT
ncbi:hypothetical protein BDQ17DRAFT_1434891 [Cyathus striatus]|nr:hypothetical protein BDQ17DRAFT_1434891 [Cyathus striatus]